MCGFGSLLSSTDQAVTVKPAVCRSWSCQECAPLRRMLCEIELRSGKPDAGLTLTLQREPGVSPERARGRMAEAFPRLMRWLRKQGMPDLAYYAVCERHKSGWPHLHVALRGWVFVPQKRISAKWRELTTTSYIVHIERGRPERMARYMAKYLAKGLAKIGGFKRYWSSRNWLQDKGEADAETWRHEIWSYLRDDTDEVVRVLSREGWHFTGHEAKGGARVGIRAPWWEPGYAPMPWQYSATGKASATAPPQGG